MTIYGDEVDKIKEYNTILKEFFSSLIYYISSFDNSLNRYLILRELYYLKYNIDKYPPVEDESKIVIKDDMISFSIIEWDGYYYENTDLNNTSLYEYFPDKKTYYKMSRDINNFKIEISRDNISRLFLVSRDCIEMKVSEKNSKKLIRKED